MAARDPPMLLAAKGFRRHAAVLVLLAEWIAPNHKKLIGLLAALFSIVEAWRRCYIYAHFTRMAYPNAFATALGSIVAAYNS